MKLSAALIVRNEHDHIEACLASLAGIDEIVVCDTGSGDDTAELARKFTPLVFTDYEWRDDFAEARNHAKGKCSGDWILSIDADETLEPGGVGKIREACANAAPGTLSFAVRMTNSGNDHRLVRVFRNVPEVRWVGAIHETISPREENFLPVTITYGYSTAHRLDPDRSMRILEREVAAHPESPRERYYLAREYYYRKRWEDAARAFAEYAGRSKFLPEKADGLLYLARCLFNLGRGDDAREACYRAVLLNPDFREALLFMSELHYEPWKSKWRKIADQATDRDVLFVRNTAVQSHKPLDMGDLDILFFESVLSRFSPVRVLEWGAGNSTRHFTDYLRGRAIPYSWRAIEHDRGWHEAVKGWNLPGVEVAYAPQGSEEYINQEGEYDVIFIDGRNRRRCLERAKELLAPNGVILLHDADREYYHSAFEGLQGRFVSEKGPTPRLWAGTKEPMAERIPKVIHQIWIGPRKRPSEWMDTWKAMNPGFEYRLWTEREIDGLHLTNRKQYDEYMAKGCYNGAANVARAEILERFGGIYADADSKCLHTLDGAPFMFSELFTVYEADDFYVDGRRLAANGIIGCVPNHPVLRRYVEAIGGQKELDPSWRQTGPLLWTRCLDNSATMLPPYTFLPVHHSGARNRVEGTVYAEQYWGTSHNSYER